MRRLGMIWVWLVYTFLYLPILIVVAYSFNAAKYTTAWSGFTLDWYAKLWNNTPLMDAALNSLSVATIAATVATRRGFLCGAALCVRTHCRLRYVIAFCSKRGGADRKSQE